jgi:hypothetical protein
MTLMLISHDLGLAASYADEVIVMYAGRIVEQAPAHPGARGPVRRGVQQRHGPKSRRAGRAVRQPRRACEQPGRDPAQVRLSTTLPVCCGATRAEAARCAESLGEHGPRMLRTGVTGDPADVTGRLAELARAGADTVYFHLYDVADTDHIRLLGREVNGLAFGSSGVLDNLLTRCNVMHMVTYVTRWHICTCLRQRHWAVRCCRS